ncbi:MAG: type II toxin-antitoxin system Phd/YefM family antitoxin [Sedimentisphaerales bacterium]|nr:type II toxin-antitoxin system Phd/YefM family antitoxin [Sedimentisphaerales bacterium]
MDTIPISQARENLTALGNRAALRGERFMIERRGRHFFALVSAEDLELLERLEDQIDLEALKERLHEPSASLAEVKKTLGL